jgi:hypothetical protein
MQGRAAGGLLLVLGSLLGTTAVVHADEKQDSRKAFQAGVKAFQDGTYEAALGDFQAADGAAHAPAITYNIARTLEKLDRPQEALDAYEAYVAEVGEGGEFTSPAVVAISQLKARATHLSIESTPSGAEIKLDGRKLRDKTPLNVLVARGPHHIELDLEAWRESRDYEAPGGGASGELVFVRSPVAAPPAPRQPRQPVAPIAIQPPAKAPPVAPHLDGLTGSAGLSLSAYRFFGSADESSGGGHTTSNSSPGGLVFGLAIDVGYALSPRAALSLRLFGGLGAAQQALATLGAGGPVLSYRLSDSVWLGGGAAMGAGRADADATTQKSSAILDSQITFRTNFALGPTLELGYVIDQNQNGHWLVELLPTLLITVTSRQSTLFVPLMLGYRWF